MRILLIVAILLSVSIFSACRHNNDGAVCESPIEVTGRNDGLGYIVVIKDGFDVNTITAGYIETYGNDINIYSVIDTANTFAAEMNDTVLSQLRCDGRIETISYNTAEPAL